ncbi:tetratricopeptide repeat protein [Bombilactobacillus bombi]|uniref:tetratricopeptide repeat protein n=1 Tax=Bombilactobacillus bombi TaxID=1303590 RepID=UPI0015E5D704|nr:tetratricopeptide repeat protein [Bombilactobacillus bombi]
MSFSNQALDAFSSGDINQAQKLVQSALKTDDADTLFDLAENLAALGISDQALLIYEKLLKDYPQEDILKVNLAEILISNDEIDRATSLLAQVKSNSNAYLSSLLVGADLYQTIGLYEVSEQKLQEALKLNTKEPVIQFALAELYFTENKFSQAVIFYEKLIEQGHKDFSGISLIQRVAAAYAGEGDYEKAVAEYKKLPLLSLNADSQANFAALEIELKHYSAAQKILDNLLTSNPDYSAGYKLAVKAANQQRDYQTALKQAQIGLGYDPFNADLYHGGSQAAMRLGDYQKAQKLLQKGIQQVAENNDLIIALSDLYLQQQQYQDNLTLLEQYQDDLIDEPRWHWNYARSQAALGEENIALKEMLSVYQQYRQNATYLKDLINILQQLEQPQLLKTAVDNYLQLVPDDEQMIELQQQLGDNSENN